MAYLILLPNLQSIHSHLVILKYLGIACLTLLVALRKLKFDRGFLHLAIAVIVLFFVDFAFYIFGVVTLQSIVSVAVRWIIFLACFLIGYNRLIKPLVWRNILLAGTIIFLAQLFFVQFHGAVTFLWGTHQDYLSQGIYRRINALASNFYAVAPFYLLLLMLWGRLRDLPIASSVFLIASLSVSRTGLVLVAARLPIRFSSVLFLLIGVTLIITFSRPVRVILEQLFLTESITHSISVSQNSSISQRLEDWITIISIFGPNFWSIDARSIAELNMEIGIGKFLLNGVVSGLFLMLALLWKLRIDIRLLSAFVLFEIFSIAMWRIDVLFLLSIWIGQCYRLKK